MPPPLDPAVASTWHALLVSWDTWLLTFVLTVVVPVIGYFRFRAMRMTKGVPSRRTKLTTYLRIICWQWSLVAVMLFVAGRHGLSAADVGERFGDTRFTLTATAGLLLVLVVVFALARRKLLRRSKPAVVDDHMRQLMPAPGLEMAAFVCVALTAGFCEELLYRGWLVNILLTATGSAGIAVFAAAAVFGIGHAYQGAKGIVRTGLVGLQLALLFVYLGTLIPGQALHAAVDIASALLLATSAARST